MEDASRNTAAATTNFPPTLDSIVRSSAGAFGTAGPGTPFACKIHPFAYLLYVQPQDVIIDDGSTEWEDEAIGEE